MYSHLLHDIAHHASQHTQFPAKGNQKGCMDWVPRHHTSNRPVAVSSVRLNKFAISEVNDAGLSCGVLYQGFSIVTRIKRIVTRAHPPARRPTSPLRKRPVSAR